MLRSKYKVSLSTLLTVMMLLSMIPIQIAIASTTMPANATVYQAESATLSGTAKVATDHTGYTGTGFVAGYDNSSTAKTTFTVTVGTSGQFLYRSPLLCRSRKRLACQQNRWTRCQWRKPGEHHPYRHGGLEYLGG